MEFEYLNLHSGSKGKSKDGLHHSLAVAKSLIVHLPQSFCVAAASPLGYKVHSTCHHVLLWGSTADCPQPKKNGDHGISSRRLCQLCELGANLELHYTPIFLATPVNMSINHTHFTYGTFGRAHGSPLNPFRNVTAFCLT